MFNGAEKFQRTLRFSHSRRCTAIQKWNYCKSRCSPPQPPPHFSKISRGPFFRMRSASKSLRCSSIFAAHPAVMWAGRSPALNHSDYLGTRSFQPAALRALAPASDLWQETAAALASGRLASFFFISLMKNCKRGDQMRGLSSSFLLRRRQDTEKFCKERRRWRGRGFCFA